MQPPVRSRPPIGFLDALRDGVVVGWARDPENAEAVATVRLMRGVEVLAEAAADIRREDGMPGFRLRSPVPIGAADLLEGRVRVRVTLAGRQAPFTLAMTLRMRAALEAEAGWEPTTDLAPPPPPAAAPPPSPPPEPPRRSVPVPPAPPPSAQRAVPEPAPEAGWALLSEPAPYVAPSAEPPPAWPLPAAEPPPAPEPPPEPPAAPGWVPAAAPPPDPLPPPSRGRAGVGGQSTAEPIPEAVLEAQPPATPAANPKLRPLQALAAAAEPANIALLHLVLPSRAAVLAPDDAPAFAALEAEAASLSAIARNWVPLAAAFARQPNPAILWRRDGARLSIEGGAALLATLLAVLRLKLPGEAGHLARADAIAARADLAALPRRDIAGSESDGPAFLGIAARETEPALTEAIFFDLPAPKPLPIIPGIEAWTSPAAPLPWRVLLLAEPGLGGSAGPDALGWWLKHLAAECVISEALPTALPEAALAIRPGLILTLSAG